MWNLYENVKRAKWKSSYSSSYLDQNLYIFNFIQEKAFENIVWKVVVILSRPQYISSSKPSDVYLQHHLLHQIQMMASCLFSAKP